MLARLLQVVHNRFRMVDRNCFACMVIPCECLRTSMCCAGHANSLSTCLLRIDMHPAAAVLPAVPADLSKMTQAVMIKNDSIVTYAMSPCQAVHNSHAQD